MPYKSGTAFRRALEDRLRRQSIETGTPLVRLRKMVAFERFLARLVTAQPDAWVLKGGLALQFRLGDRSRTTQDMDLLLNRNLMVREIHQMLVGAALLDLGDWFAFEVARPAMPNGLRFSVRCLVDGRRFEIFHVDVGVGDPLTAPVEMLTAPPLLAFAGIQPVSVPAYPVVQQIAEKVHALTRPHPGGTSSRVKDWADILLLAHWGRAMKAQDLRSALQATFEARRTHPLPMQMPAPPAAWKRPYRRLAQETGLEFLDLETATQALHRFLNPVLSGQSGQRWNPSTWEWE